MGKGGETSIYQNVSMNAEFQSCEDNSLVQSFHFPNRKPESKKTEEPRLLLWLIVPEHVQLKSPFTIPRHFSL